MHAQLLGEPPETISFGVPHVVAFAQAVTENWQSEYLQFTLFILSPSGSSRRARPSPSSARERRSADGAHVAGSPRCGAGGGASGCTQLAGAVWPDLALVGLAQLTGWSECRARARAVAALWLPYLGSDFWEATLQNWQSEFLRGRLDGRAGHLPAPARLAGVQAGRVPASLDGRGGVRSRPM